MIKAVIFDMDGVLIDSEIVYLRHQHANLKTKYPWVTEQSLYPLVGMSSQEDKQFLAGLLHRDAKDPAFLQEIQELYAACTVYYPDIMRPQVPGLLKALKDMGMQVALASSSSMKNIRQVLGQCEIEQFFDCIISGESFRRSKPDPEIYCHTMEKLGRTPDECLIIEDSTYGVKAGVASGATVAALRDDRFPFDQSPAQLHIESLDEIPALAACGGHRIKAAFFDIDGTLAEEGTHRIPDSTRSALSALRENGIAVLVSTGRHAMEIEEENLLDGLTFDGGIYLNGQLCELNGQVVHGDTLPASDLLGLKKFLEETENSCIFLERSCMYTNLVNEAIIAEQARIGTAVPPVRDLEGLENRKIYQAIPFITARDEAKLLAAMPNCVLFRWGKSVVDINCKGCGKDAGLLAMCRAMGITKEQTIAFGDAQNDIAILRQAGIGVAMGNAIEAAKESADYVTAPLNEDGIEKALKHFCLIP